MKITADNYIEIFIDYFDGKLTAEETVELMQFVAQHPTLQKEFEQMQTMFLQPAEAEKVNFVHLLKDINQRDEVNATNFEELCIAELEGELHNASLRGQLYQWINASEANQKIFALYKQTKTRPDEKIVFPNKKILKKREKLIELSWIYSGVAVAASLALLIGIGKWWMSIHQPSTTPSPILFHTYQVTPEMPNQVKGQQNTYANNEKFFVRNISQRTQPLATNDSVKTALSKKEAFPELNELTPRMAMAETYIPYRDFIIIEETIFYRNYQNSPGNEKPYLTLGEWVNERITSWKNAILNLPAESPLSRVTNTNIQQLSLLAGNHVIFRQNTDTLEGRKQVEVNLGWVAFYFSYAEGNK